MEDKNIIRQCKALAEKECANYCNHMCLPEDLPCHVINSRYTTVQDGAIDCDWFTEAVLPGSPELNKLVLNELFRDSDTPTSGTRKCEKCSELYVPSSPRQKYCVACGKAVKKRQNREKQRRHKDRIRSNDITNPKSEAGQNKKQEEVKGRNEGS